MASQIRVRKNPKSAFLEQYQLEKRVLLREDKNKGVAALRVGTDSNGNSVLIKSWTRDLGIDDTDVRDIWRNEIRQLYRLAGYPGVSDYIAELLNSGEDETGFYLVLSLGQRRPLEYLLLSNPSDSTRPATRSLQERSNIWANLRRIASGLEILHLQGLLHRNLTTWSILTSDGGALDFQLTGFEWSMRLVTADSHTGGRSTPEFINQASSFIKDWQQFGKIAAALLSISMPRLMNVAIATHDVSETIFSEETWLIRELLQVFVTNRIDGRFVIDRIDKILVRLSLQAQKQESEFSLVLVLGPNSPLAGSIREASGREIEIDDEAAQRTFVESDLFSPIAISVKGMDQASGFRLVLRGQRLTYSIEDFIYGVERTPSNWTFGYCRRAETNAPQANQTIKQITLSSQVIKILSPVEARSKMSRVRGRIASWESLRVQLEPAPEQISAERNLHKSLALGQMLEYVFAAADVFPVEILKSQASTAQSEDGRVRLVVRARADAERESLSKALALTTPAARLGEALSSDLVETTDRVPTWTLTDSSTLGERSEVSTEWQYEGTEIGADGGQTFLFVGDLPTSFLASAFLVSDEAVGRDSQFKRRMKSFRVLGEHAELSRMLIDPRAKVFRHEDGFASDSHLENLDESKQKAFNAAMQTIPLFLIQGPPGVGKTRLVRELVRRTLTEDSSTRLLLSAQSNASLDHLLQEIEGIFKGVADEPLMVRCKPKEKEEEASQFNISHQTRQLLGKLSKGALYREAPVALRRRVDSLREAYGEDFQSSESRAVPQATVSSRKALEGLVLRSANLVFATANSADLERLIEEKGQFDWTIIEEAAKATGGELVSPLLLSHRRLMIGDHKQLPPFNAERFLRLLEAPKAVRRALQVAEPMIGPTFRDATIEEVFTEADGDGDVESDSSFASLCSEAVRNFSLFETLIEDEFDRQKRGGSGKPIATSLTNQHRMHPGIAEVVSRAFYEELGLSTDKNRSEFYRSSPSPVVSVDTN